MCAREASWTDPFGLERRGRRTGFCLCVETPVQRQGERHRGGEPLIEREPEPERLGAEGLREEAEAAVRDQVELQPLMPEEAAAGDLEENDGHREMEERLVELRRMP